MFKSNKKTIHPGYASIDNKALEFRKVVESYRKRVFQTAYGIVQNPDDAKDITQDVFLKVFEKMDTFKGEASLSTWIYRITVNTCIDMLRKRKTGMSVTLEDGLNYNERMQENSISSHLPDSPFDTTYQGELRKAIKEAFMKLSPEHRSTLVLREIEGLSYQQISDMMECSLGTVMSRLHYARKKMQKLLAPLEEKAS
jgi:RNA polymerase sigma-70 factor (ECF subfamily)